MLRNKTNAVSDAMDHIRELLASECDANFRLEAAVTYSAKLPESQFALIKRAELLSPGATFAGDRQFVFSPLRYPTSGQIATWV
mgnify:CR=1 FL=1